MSDLLWYRDLEFVGFEGAKVKVCFPTVEDYKGAFGFTLHRSPSATLVCVGGKSMAREDASTYCYGEGIDTDYPAPPVSLG